MKIPFIVHGIIFQILLLHISISAQNTLPKEESEYFPSKYNSDKAFKPFVALEMWGTYSIDPDDASPATSDRFDTSIRRFRFGASGSPYAWLAYSFQFNADRLREDNNAYTKGSYGGIDIWNAYTTFKILPTSELLNVHMGYFWAANARTFNTSPWAVSPFDKTRADWFLRSFVTGKGNGIESGLGLGGLHNFDYWGLSYRLGTYEPEAYATQQYSDRLYTGRLMISLGDPEETKYKYMLAGNYFNNKKGVTVGIGGSTQDNGKLSDSTVWNHSYSYGADIMINYMGLKVDGEYFLMKRTADDLKSFEGIEYHVTVGYNIGINSTFIEPNFTYEYYEGKGSKSLFKQIGDDRTYDFGINWYLDGQRVKLSLHYVKQDGEISSKLGDYIGTSFQLKL